MTGITLSTRVGRLSETHFDNCIQLTQFPEERNGSTVRVRSIEDVLTSGLCTTAAAATSCKKARAAESG